MNRAKQWLFDQYMKRHPGFAYRIDAHLIGYTGHVSDLDRRVSLLMDTPAPSKFEGWLAREFVEEEKRIRRSLLAEILEDLT